MSSSAQAEGGESALPSPAQVTGPPPSEQASRGRTADGGSGPRPSEGSGGARAKSAPEEKRTDENHVEIMLPLPPAEGTQDSAASARNPRVRRLKPRVNVEEFDFDNMEANPKRINSPVSKEAFRRTGILPEELMFVPEWAVPGDSKNPSIRRIRYEHQEENRKTKIALVLRTYHELKEGGYEPQTSRVVGTQDSLASGYATSRTSKSETSAGDGIGLHEGTEDLITRQSFLLKERARFFENKKKADEKLKNMIRAKQVEKLRVREARKRLQERAKRDAAMDEEMEKMERRIQKRHRQAVRERVRKEQEKEAQAEKERERQKEIYDNIHWMDLIKEKGRREKSTLRAHAEEKVEKQRRAMEAMQRADEQRQRAMENRRLMLEEKAQERQELIVERNQMRKGKIAAKVKEKEENRAAKQKALEKIERSRKMMLEKKLQEAEERLERKTEEQQQRFKEMREAKAQIDAERRVQLERKHEEYRKKLTKAVHISDMREIQRRRKAMEDAITRQNEAEIRQLRRQDKLELCERKRRIVEYERQQIRAKIEDNDAKIADFSREREELLRDKIVMSAFQSRQRQLVRSVLDDDKAMEQRGLVPRLLKAIEADSPSITSTAAKNLHELSGLADLDEDVPGQNDEPGATEGVSTHPMTSPQNSEGYVSPRTSA